MFNCSGFIFVYGINLIVVGAGILLTKILHRLHYLLMFLTLMASHATLTIVVLLCTFNWVVEYGHVPTLDSYVREHDKESVCWKGIVRLDYNSIGGANCYRIGEVSYCALCRKEYYHDELTFLKLHRFELALVLLLLFVLNAYTLWKLHKIYGHMNDNDEDNNNNDAISKSTEIKSSALSSLTSISLPSQDKGKINEEYYAVPKNNKPITTLRFTTSTTLPLSSSSSSSPPSFLPPPPPPPFLSSFSLKNTYWHNNEENQLLPPPPKSWFDRPN